MPDHKSFLAPLRHKGYRQFWLGSITSNLGALIQGVGAAWMMTSISSSDHMVALVQATTAMPIMLLSLVAGAVADNFERRRVILLAQIFMLIASATLTFCAWFGLLSPWMLLAFTFVIGCGTAVSYPSWQASIGDVVPREEVSRAVSLNAVAVNLTRSIGPALGGLLVAASGAAGAFAATTMCYLALTIMLLRWNIREKISGLPREHMGRAIKAGLSYFIMSPNLMNACFRGFCFGASAIAVLALLPIVAHRKLEGGPITFGMMLGAFGIGAVIAALLNARLRARFANETIIALSFGGFAISEAIIALSQTIALSVAAVVLAGACWVIALSLFNTAIQLSSPRWVVGRSLSLYQTAIFSGMAGGSWLWGHLAESYSIGLAFWIAALLTLGGMLLGFLMPMPSLESHDLSPLQQFREPKLHLDISPNSGSIAINIDFEIADEDTEEFLQLMAWRRRVRIRDGANDWMLMRDLEHPTQWTEFYRTATWADYIRHNQRRTKADGDQHERLLELHRGPKPVMARRFIERSAISADDELLHQIISTDAEPPL